MKKCPFCAEEIQDEAIVCRYCGRELESQLPPDDRKKCPYCDEWIQVEAIVCRYCGQDLAEEEIPIPEIDEPIVSEAPPEKVATTRPWYRQTWFYICTILFAPLFVLLAITDRKPPYWVRIVFWIILISWVPLCLLVSGMMTESFFPNLGPISEIFSGISENIPFRIHDATSTPLPGGKPTFNIFNTITPTKPELTINLPTKKPSQTPGVAEILQWDEISENDEGKRICVYGSYWQSVIMEIEPWVGHWTRFGVGKWSVKIERDYSDLIFYFYDAKMNSGCGNTKDCVMGTGTLQVGQFQLINGPVTMFYFIDMEGQRLECCK